MTILIPLHIGNPDIVFADLVDIVRCDAGLTASEPTLFARQVAYSQKQAAVASSSRILELVNSPVTTHISGVGFSEVIPDAGAISEKAGIFRRRASPEQPNSIWYDITDAAGQHWVVKDKDSQEIHMARQVILYHELAHSYHEIKGDLPPISFDAEVQAIADENVFRGQLGLTLRNSTNHYGGPGTPSHGGVAFPKCTPEKKGWSPGWKCAAVVATAALQSSEGVEIAALRRARAEYRNMGLWGALIAQPALDVYGKFGPHLGRAMQEQPALRDAMLWFVVLPTFHLLHVAESYLAADADTLALKQTIREELLTYLSGLGSTRWHAGALPDVADNAIMAANLLATGARPSHLPLQPELPEDLFSGVAREILAVNGRPPAAFAWAFEGLAAFLRGAAQLAEGSDVAVENLLPKLSAWVVHLPLPPLIELRLADAGRELKVLASRVFTRAETRVEFARNLVAHWNESSADDLKALLRVLGYLNGQRS